MREALAEARRAGEHGDVPESPPALALLPAAARGRRNAARRVLRDAAKGPVRGGLGSRIVLPVFFTLEGSRASLQAGRPGEAIGQFLAALVLNALIVILLFDLPLGQIWPVLLIISGFSLLVSRRGWAV